MVNNCSVLTNKLACAAFHWACNYEFPTRKYHAIGLGSRNYDQETRTESTALECVRCVMVGVTYFNDDVGGRNEINKMRHLYVFPSYNSRVYFN